MEGGFRDLYSGCILNIALFILVVLLGVLFKTAIFIILLVMIAPFSFLYGRKIIAKLAGPDIALWLYTSNIGVAFAYISIDLFRQDKKFTKSELDKLCNYFAAEFGQGVYKTIKEFTLKNKAKKVDLKYQTGKIRDLNFKHRALFLHHLFSMALANGKYTTEEDLFMQQVAKLIRINKENFLNIKANFVKTDNQQHHQNHQKSKQSDKKQYNGSKSSSSSKKFFSPSYTSYLILGLNKFATNEEVKKAYRKLAVQYHPDKQTNKSKLELKLAQQKFREVTEAYEVIKNERGLK